MHSWKLKTLKQVDIAAVTKGRKGILHHKFESKSYDCIDLILPEGTSQMCRNNVSFAVRHCQSQITEVVYVPPFVYLENNNASINLWPKGTCSFSAL
ncbi:hypothetical protein MTR_1g093660 [Medicago truncatula]|uniref:Uncharacterized protein n=1 Tax=Medicago truncatula TaxID=3880 RepID=G7I496_MEDTR|nr:hypothetical protein MTR_1g093660 [Medicago truncatula]